MRRRALPAALAAAGALGALVWRFRTTVLPARPDHAPTPRPRRIPEPAARPSPDGRGVRIAVNPTSGPAWTSNPTDELRTGLPAAEIVELGPDDDLTAVLAAASNGDLVAIGAAGGDGTLSAVAPLAAERDLVLVAVPTGTLNHLARDLGLDDVDDAVAAVRAGTVTAMDLGVVRPDDGDGDGERTFVNTLSFGGYTDVVDARERMKPRLGKWLALLVALVRELPGLQPLHLEIDGTPTKVWLGWVGNGRYAPEGFGPSWRERLDDGNLDVRLVLGGARHSRLRFVLDVFAGRLLHSRHYAERQATEVRVTSLDGPLRMAVDGETFDGPRSFTIAKHRRAIRVAVPPG